MLVLPAAKTFSVCLSRYATMLAYCLASRAFILSLAPSGLSPNSSSGCNTKALPLLRSIKRAKASSRLIYSTLATSGRVSRRLFRRRISFSGAVVVKYTLTSTLLSNSVSEAARKALAIITDPIMKSVTEVTKTPVKETTPPRKKVIKPCFATRFIFVQNICLLGIRYYLQHVLSSWIVSYNLPFLHRNHALTQEIYHALIVCSQKYSST